MKKLQFTAWFVTLALAVSLSNFAKADDAQTEESPEMRVQSAPPAAASIPPPPQTSAWPTISVGGTSSNAAFRGHEMHSSAPRFRSALVSRR
jgi:hypothetical protein